MEFVRIFATPQFQVRIVHTPRTACRLKQQVSQSRSFRTTALRHREAKGGAPAKIRGQSKLYASADEAVADIQSGSIVLSSGFGLCGTAETLIAAMARRGVDSLHSLTAVSNNAGTAIGGGLSPLIQSGQVSRAICSFLGNNKALEKKYLTGEIAIELTPQGTLAEKLRCGGAGIPAFFTPTGVNTYIQSGQIPARLKDGEVVESGKARETRIFDGRVYNMETAIKGDVAVLRAHKVDKAGNVKFRYTTKSFAPLMAKAAKVSIVEAEHIVEIGDIAPDEIDLPGVFIDRIVQATEDKILEVKKLRSENDIEAEGSKSDALARRNRIAKRAAKELKPGYYVNLGVGMPTLAPSFLPPDNQVWIQSENGILGMGPYPTEEEIDADIINAGKETVTLVRGASVFDSSESFGMIRGGHIDVSMLGALQVGANGDLANYMIPGKVFKGMGGAMDLVSNPDATKIVVLTDHVDKYGVPKIVEHCTLPLTGARVVSTIITDLCVFEVDRKRGGLTLTELAPGVGVDEIKQKTGAKFAVAEPVGKME
ncbi:succinyl-CoA:3-ketoacid-coenzyme A transferase like protein [Zymoseptoria brevis]|uniref:Succinyl-CoA:3-ketoacid-coenzyme A transferase n=1 Tax=Zymoseptoria brevis TaxID=1047168 RepID=A0A0F4GDF3_9PEZI|nr:succinyl-CoA:3-ketoacid-coenzyme A transferase like protein [Zymoseptoria brevis]